MQRRRLLQSLALTPAAPAAPPDRDVATITVTGLEILTVKVNKRGNWMLTRLQTSAGITGIGDASHGGGDEERRRYLQQFFELLKGRSIYDIEYLRGAAEPAILKGARGFAPAAIALSGIEQALWDIRGKAFNVPAYDLFGGLLHPKIRNYANINRSTEIREPAGFAAMAERAVAAGFDAIKLAPFDDMPRDLSDAARTEEFTKMGIARADAVRKVIGPKRDLLVDVHSHLDVDRGLQLARRMEYLDLFWLEEVTPAVPVENLARINREAKMPTAGGESIYGVRGFLPYIAGKAVDIAMPDVKYCGGMLELKKIAALCEAAGVPVAPHGPASPVGNLAAAHVCATLPNFQILEFSYGETDWRSELVDPPEALDKGYIHLSRRPGLGVTLNEKTLAKYKA
ncbi:MAG TPA: mandelate racemase/muconate lactonizing enzyme family protein [Bryobacteraceae bacterium]|nr:mandelate racemase/muconate lactonizing enzyme family protein [Bryobacteraceae bacterium]